MRIILIILWHHTKYFTCNRFFYPHFTTSQFQLNAVMWEGGPSSAKSVISQKPEIQTSVGNTIFKDGKQMESLLKRWMVSTKHMYGLSVCNLGTKASYIWTWASINALSTSLAVIAGYENREGTGHSWEILTWKAILALGSVCMCLHVSIQIGIETDSILYIQMFA